MSKKIIGSIVAFVLIASGIYFVLHSSRSAPKSHVFTDTMISGTAKFSIVMKNIVEDGLKASPKGNYKIDAQYPVVSGLVNPASNEIINKTIYEAIVNDIDNFKQDLAGGVIQKGDQSTLSVVTATSTPRDISMVSFIVAQEFYSAGAAHPGNQINTFNFDPVTGKVLTLDDLFVGDYLKTLSTYSRTVLVAQLGQTSRLDGNSDQLIKDGTAPTLDNFKVLVPEDDGVHVIFNEYQVASYAAGSQEVVVPYSSLTAVINPKGPLKGLK